jgi:molybdopterin-guanine dinucleotide biosynthesis protein A
LPDAGQLPFVGAVLAGGKSTRMGTDKAFVEVEGRPMAGRVAAALRAAGATEVLAIGGDLERLPSHGFDRAFPDRHPGEGPLGGVLTALAVAGHDVVVVLACDLPAASAESVVAVLQGLGDHDVAVAMTDRREPLHGAWRASRCLPVLADAFERGERAVHRALALLDVGEVTVADPSTLRSVNRPADLHG